MIRHPEQSKSSGLADPRGSRLLTRLTSPVIGQLNGRSRAVSGLIPGNPTKDINFLKQHVVSRGGEYFFVPSIQTIKVSFLQPALGLVRIDITT